MVTRDSTAPSSQRDEQGGGEGGAVPPPETVVFDIDEQVEHGVHRQPGEWRADTDVKPHGAYTRRLAGQPGRAGPAPGRKEVGTERFGG